MPKLLIRSLAALAGLPFFLLACGADSPTDPETPNRRPVADAGLDQAVVAHNTAPVTLDGSGSTDPDHDPLTYSWAFVSRPEGSTAALSAATAVRPTFVADLAGDYIIQLTVSDGQLDDQDVVTVRAACPEPIEISGIYSTPQTYGPDIRNCTDYTVTGNTQFRAAVTVQPGTWIAVTNNREIRVMDTGSFSAVGTAAAPVRILGSEAQQGWWRSLAVTSNNPNNELTHVILSDGGISSSNSNHVSTMLFVASGARLLVRSSVIRNSNGYGLYANLDANLSGFADNRFEGNAGAPLSIAPRTVGYLDGETLYEDPAGTPNGESYIEVRSGDVNSSQTWPRLNLPLRLTATVLVIGNSVLTIAPGAEIEFQGGTGLRVSCASGGGRAISAVGTAQAPITLRGVSAGAGAWGGVDFCSADPENRLIHVAIRGGGQSYYSGRQSANVFVPADGRVEIRNSEIRESSGWGVWAHGTATLVPADPTDAGAANMFGNNASGDVNR